MLNVTRADDGALAYTDPDGHYFIASGDFANCTLPACPVELSVYGYRASLPFSALAIAFFGLCAAVQIFLCVRYRTWSFMAAILLGCVSEIIGYIGRILMWENPWDDAGFIMQIVLITIGPVFFSAAIYVMIYQITHYISVNAARFSPRLFYWIFIPCDIVSLILQATGGAMSATSNGSSSAGVNIALAGLAFQVATLVLFIVAVVDYAILTRHVWLSIKQPVEVKLFSAFLRLSTLLILTRCSYRVYELSEGYSRDSEALRDQPLFIGLEGCMILAAAWCLAIAHPGRVFKTGQKSLEEKETETTQNGSVEHV